MYVKINGEMHYLWRAVDHEGEVLESFATKERDKAAALKFMKKLMKRTAAGAEDHHRRAAVLQGGDARAGQRASRSRPLGQQPGWRTATSPCDDESGRCSGSAG
jgi:hypothetical protein